MRAVIIAGGKGRRLAPYTTVLPKPLMPVGDYSILEIVIRQLKSYGFTHITMAVGYLSELIRAVLDSHKNFGLEIDYSFEEKPLGTIGPLSLIDGLDDTFLVMNGDVLTTLDLRRLIKFHKDNRSVATVATHNHEVSVAYGVITTNDRQEIVDYQEKPRTYYRVSMGIVLFEPEVMKHLRSNEHMNLPDFLLKLIAAKKKVMAYPSDGYWLDIGIPQEYARAIEDFESDPGRFLPDLREQ
ncbi:MAG: sugar phosphate nucleotidyltransferase [Planctomycetota bacterium]